MSAAAPLLAALRALLNVKSMKELASRNLTASTPESVEIPRTSSFDRRGAGDLL